MAEASLDARINAEAMYMMRLRRLRGPARGCLLQTEIASRPRCRVPFGSRVALQNSWSRSSLDDLRSYGHAQSCPKKKRARLNRCRIGCYRASERLETPVPHCTR